MSAEANNKLILAILQGDDYADTVSELTHNGFFVTLLNTTGGFLRKKNITILVGVETSRYVELMDLLKGRAGRRKKVMYATPAMMPGVHLEAAVSAVPIQVDTGGATVFTLELEGLEKI